MDARSDSRCSRSLSACILFTRKTAQGTAIVASGPTWHRCALWRTADADAVRLDEREAPKREVARQQKEAEALRLSQEKARLTNKAAFKP